MTKTAQNEIDADTKGLVSELTKYDAEISFLQNLGFTTSTQYHGLRCRLDGVQIYGKDGEDFGLWDSYFEEVPYEDAVKEAGPIFKNAIRSMTITDAAKILFGAENAATEYLKASTYNQLREAFAPKIGESLAKPLVAGVSTSETWNVLHNGFNKVAGSTAGMLLGLKKVDISLQDYVTERALDALFLKVAEEEKAIRTDPKARVNALLKRVFGQLDKN